tara:strand:+ start:5185 stop:5607 length:423 start_codon:yes stop_codon:yes gene_type:complete
MALKVPVTGNRSLKNKLDKAKGAMRPRIIGQVLRVEVEKIMTEAKRQTPVDTGALRASGHVQGPGRLMGNIEVIGGFGGPAGVGENQDHVDYAVTVHEDLTANHTVGNAKYLENAWLSALPGLERRIASRVHSLLKRGIG